MKKALGVFLAILIATIAACGALKLFSSKPARPFPHKAHVQDQQMECIACHPKAGEEDKVAMLASLKKCMTCHEGGDEKKPPERKLAALYPGEKPAWSAVTALNEDVIFSHKTHVEKKVACDECHKGIETNTGVDEGLRVTMDACMECHTRRGKSNDCSVCHKTISRDAPPKSHALSWKETHGRVVRSGATGQLNQCSLCHTQSQCVSCHQDEAPKSHTNFWRIQGHAVAAGIDRSACSACHRADFCDRCHQETPPRSHVGSWSEPQNRHCVSCHNPVSSQTCNACHAGARHGTAPSRPTDGNHAGASLAQCQFCHTTQGMPHPDNGDDCRGCHP